MRILHLVLNLVLAPLVVVLAVAFVAKLIAMKEPPRSRKPPAVTPKVAVVESRPDAFALEIKTFGNVRAFQQTQVASQVGGKILSVSEKFQRGEAVAANEVLVTIEQADYLAEVKKQEAALATAERTLAEEESRSRIARQDWIDTGRDPDEAPPFTLRVPQLAAAKAEVESATAALAKANLDLERTEIRPPYPAIVQDRAASPGDIVNPGSPLGTLIDRARAEVRLPLTPEQAAQLELPLTFALEGGDIPVLTTTLTTSSQPGAEWTATVTRTEPSLDAANQVLYVVAEVPRPFDDPDAFLPIGAFVNATIAGRPVPGVHRLPESALIEDRYVWILDADDTLRQQPVERLFSSSGFFLARVANPLTPGALRVATRPLVSFAAGNPAVAVDPNAPPPARPPGPRPAKP